MHRLSFTCKDVSDILSQNLINIYCLESMKHIQTKLPLVYYYKKPDLHAPICFASNVQFIKPIKLLTRHWGNCTINILTKICFSILGIQGHVHPSICKQQPLRLSLLVDRQLRNRPHYDINLLCTHYKSNQTKHNSPIPCSLSPVQQAIMNRGVKTKRGDCCHITQQHVLQ